MFEVGQKVKATQLGEELDGIEAGTVGEIVEVDEDDNDFPYNVSFQDADDSWTTWCSEDEIEELEDEE